MIALSISFVTKNFECNQFTLIPGKRYEHENIMLSTMYYGEMNDDNSG